MHTTRSASRAAGPSRSTSETHSTDSIPSLRHARTIRSAISPRLATNTREIVMSPARGSCRQLHSEQRLPELHELRVLGAHLNDRAGDPRLNRVHHLHHL